MSRCFKQTTILKQKESYVYRLFRKTRMPPHRQSSPWKNDQIGEGNPHTLQVNIGVAKAIPRSSLQLGWLDPFCPDWGLASQIELAAQIARRQSMPHQWRAPTSLTPLSRRSLATGRDGHAAPCPHLAPHSAPCSVDEEHLSFPTLFNRMRTAAAAGSSGRSSRDWRASRVYGRGGPLESPAREASQERSGIGRAYYNISTGAPKISAGMGVLRAPADAPLLSGAASHTDAPSIAGRNRLFYTK
jgi:hypothetical protein